MGLQWIRWLPTIWRRVNPKKILLEKTNTPADNIDELFETRIIQRHRALSTGVRIIIQVNFDWSAGFWKFNEQCKQLEKNEGTCQSHCLRLTHSETSARGLQTIHTISRFLLLWRHRLFCRFWHGHHRNDANTSMAAETPRAITAAQTATLQTLSPARIS